MTIWIERFQLTDEYPLAVKDSIDIAGYITGLGSRVTHGQPVAEQDAEVVTRLKSAGYGVAGKVNMHELAFGMTGVNPHFGTPENSNFPRYITGGSSSGSAAAVANGDVDVALGTDTGGSVRIPAACCGVFGFKPTFGRVSRQGVWPENTSLDCVGGVARELTVLHQLHAILDPDLDWRLPDSSFDAGAVGYFSMGADSKIDNACRTVLTHADVHYSTVDIPLFEAAFEAGLTVIGHETFQACAEYVQGDELGDDVKTRLNNAAHITQDDLYNAEGIRNTFTDQINQLLEKYPLLVTPALPGLPMLRADALNGKQDLNISWFARPFNLSGHPALVIPVSTGIEGPCGLQLIARKNCDNWLFSAAAQLINSSK